ncbi:hypothetical protein H5410_061206 [Solanum commersonii]|uniref:Uncharacterized protein n=1 Tax=Solanum commersonii TaxID=4109 RepID=A0A9J5W8F9_SOLCO|nr:hypothetical protein H5410_061206 [Solanum commersonii]
MHHKSLHHALTTTKIPRVLLLRYFPSMRNLLVNLIHLFWNNLMSIKESIGKKELCGAGIYGEHKCTPLRQNFARTSTSCSIETETNKVIWHRLELILANFGIGVRMAAGDMIKPMVTLDGIYGKEILKS